MSTHSKKTLIFDFDGTLADSVDEAISFANVLLAKARKAPISKPELRRLGVRAAIESRKVSHIQLILFLLFGRHNLARHIETLDLFPGLKHQLQKLAQSHRLGIITSNSRVNVVRFLKHHQIEHYFTFIESQLSLFSKHKKIKKAIASYDLIQSQTIYIGDETRDVIAAKQAGIQSCAVSWGFEGAALLAKAEPDFLLSEIKLLNTLAKK